MAPRTDPGARFRRRISLADSFATGHEKGSHQTTGAPGSIFTASLLCASFILLRRSYSDGQCLDAKWVAAIRASERDTGSNVNHRQNFFQERGQDRTAKKATSIFRIEFLLRKQCSRRERIGGGGLGGAKLLNQRPCYRAHSAGCPQPPSKTKSERGFRVRGAASRSRNFSESSSGLPGYPIAAAATGS